jgi:hypothetical protein
MEGTRLVMREGKAEAMRAAKTPPEEWPTRVKRSQSMAATTAMSAATTT